MSSNKRRTWAAMATLVCTLAASAGIGLADPGELFSNVAPYDDTVSSPISKPEIKKPAPAPAPTVTPAHPPTTTPPTVTPEQNPGQEPPKPGRRAKPIVVAGTQPSTTPAAPVPTLVEFLPYADVLLVPIVTPEEDAAFNTEYADTVTKALAASVEQRRKSAELLESASQTVSSATMKRYLLLHAFGLFVRSSTPLPEREQKAQLLLTMLTEHTLPVLQARADALNDMLLTFSSNPNDRFMDLYVDAYAMLAKYQVQAGYPKEAVESLKRARAEGLHYIKKPQVRQDELNESGAWVERATAATALSKTLETKLRMDPNDPVANTTIATLHLSLYGNLEHAETYAAKSDRKDMKALAAVLKDNPPDDLSKDPAKHAEQVLAIATALVDVAKATSVSQTFDRYSIACYAGDHVAQLLDDGTMPADKTLMAKALLASAKDIVDKTALRRGDDQPKWLGGRGATTMPNTVAKPPTPEIKCVGTVEDFFRALPKELAPTSLGWSTSQEKQINDWFAKNLVGKDFNGTARIERVDQATDAPGGKTYVPVHFVMLNVQLAENLWMHTYVEDRVPPAVAIAAKNSMDYGQFVNLKGVITSVRLEAYSSARGYATLQIVLTQPPPK